MEADAPILIDTRAATQVRLEGTIFDLERKNEQLGKDLKLEAERAVAAETDLKRAKAEIVDLKTGNETLKDIMKAIATFKSRGDRDCILNLTLRDPEKALERVKEFNSKERPRKRALEVTPSPKTKKRRAVSPDPTEKDDPDYNNNDEESQGDDELVASQQYASSDDEVPVPQRQNFSIAPESAGAGKLLVPLHKLKAALEKVVVSGPTGDLQLAVTTLIHILKPCMVRSLLFCSSLSLREPRRRRHVTRL